MSYHPDIVVTNEAGTPFAWVEVKSTRYSDAFEYAEYYNAAAKGGFPEDLRYFMVVTLAEISLWDRAKSESMKKRFGENLATYSVVLPKPLQKSLPRYLEMRTEGRSTYRDLLARIVFQWLIHLRASGADAADPAESMLKEVGFIDALRGAHLELERAA